MKSKNFKRILGIVLTGAVLYSIFHIIALILNK